MPSECLSLQAPPMHSASAPSRMLLPATAEQRRELLIALNKGHLHMYHLFSGIKVALTIFLILPLIFAGYIIASFRDRLMYAAHLINIQY